jgi:peroxiredoxin
VQARLGEFRSLGARVIALSFVEPKRLRAYLDRHPSSIPVLADPQRHAYQAFGLGRATWFELVRLRVIARYVWLILRGRRPRMAQEDVHQLGGDFVLDRSGRVVFAHRSTDPSDRPAVSELLNAVRGIASRGR